MGLEPTASENMAQRFIPNEASGQTYALTHEIGGPEGSRTPVLYVHVAQSVHASVPSTMRTNGTAYPQGLLEVVNGHSLTYMV